jgi:GxxExxY protein
MMTNHYKEPPEYLDLIGKKVVDATYKVHIRWGPGLFEHFYQKAMYKELTKKGLNVQTEVYLPVKLDDMVIENAYKMDLLVENEVVVEIKTVDKLSSAHFKQIKTYLKLSNNTLGYLINFNTELAKDGINRIILSTYSNK